MIIRFCVNDNDFSSIMSEFLSDFTMRILELSIDSRIDDENVEALREWRVRERKIREIINPNNSKKMSLEDEKYLINQIHKVFGDFVDNRYPADAKYLKDNLDVSIIEACVDKWENGEAFYWFQHSNVVVNQ